MLEHVEGGLRAKGPEYGAFIENINREVVEAKHSDHFGDLVNAVSEAALTREPEDRCKKNYEDDDSEGAACPAGLARVGATRSRISSVTSIV
jgi:hypothetical protein